MRPLESALLAALFVASVCVGFRLAHGAPPEHGDPALVPWFEAQKIPGTTASCCSVADGRGVPYRIVGDHYEALITAAAFPWVTEDRWREVPADAMLRGQTNPTGRAIAWVSKSDRTIEGHAFKLGDIMCFIRPSET